MQILQPEHIKEYLQCSKCPRTPSHVLSGAGQRIAQGELTALLWSDLDIQNRTIYVSKQYVKNPNGELTPSRPKRRLRSEKYVFPEAVRPLIAEHGKHPESPYVPLAGNR